MKRGGLFWKLFLAFAALSVATVVLFGLLAIPSLTRAEEREAEASLRTFTAVLAEWARPVLAGDADPAMLQGRLSSLGRDGPVRLTVVAPDGRVLAETHYDLQAMGDHRNRPEIVEAREHGVGSAARRSATLGARMMYVARRVDQDGQARGFVRAAQSLEAIDARKARLVRVLVSAALGASLVGLGLAFLLSRRLTKPIRAISEAAIAVAHGDYGREVPAVGHDEIGRLARTFNRMGQELRDRIETISRDRMELLAMLSAMAEGVVAVDADERVVLINDAAGRLLGVEPGAAVGRRVWEVTRVLEIGEVLMRAVHEGRREAGEATILRKPRDRYIQLLAAPVRVPGGEVQGAVLVLHDISDLRHLEKVRRDFVANVSHELKTPLAAIRGFAETILEDPAMDAETRQHFVERIRLQAIRLAELVDEVLALSRLESQTDAVARVPVDLVAALDEVLQSLQPMARERGLVLEASLPDAPLTVRGDEEGLRRVASNLLDNALKYTPSGGRVWLRLREDGRWARLEVEDTGIGIPPEARERVFERFYRVDPGRSRAAGGTGLGLSIVKHLVLAMQGEVRAEARDGGGSRFVVELPLARADDDPTNDGAMTRKGPPKRR